MSYHLSHDLGTLEVHYIKRRGNSVKCKPFDSSGVDEMDVSGVMCDRKLKLKLRTNFVAQL